MLLSSNICQETIKTWQIIGIFLTIIKIIIPLIIIIFGTIDVGKIITSKPEDEAKLVIKKITNRLIAALIVFLIPNLINASLRLFTNYKEQLDYAECDECFTKPTSSNCKTYIEQAKKAIEAEETKPKEEEELKGSVDTSELKDSTSSSSGKDGKLNFSYEGNGKVKSQFSSDTLKIVENHLYDLNYNNFNQVISSHGGFENYVKTLGGVFSEYYGKQLSVTTEYELQRVAEYVFGFMYMYGTDYCSGGAYHKWGDGVNHSDDAFFTGDFVAPHCTPDFNTEFDDVISGTGKHQDLIIATECGPAAWAVLSKSGIWPPNEDRKPILKTRSINDLRPGDLIRFFDTPESSTDHAKHVALIGEVYDDRIVVYDGGSYFQTNRDFKRTVMKPTNGEDDNSVIKREFGFGGWQAERFLELKRS